MFSKQFSAIALCVLPALAAPSPLVPAKRSENPILGSYIVTFKPGDDRLAVASSLTSRLSSQSKVTHEWDIIDGFAGKFTNDDLEFLSSHPNVVSIEENTSVYTQTSVIQ